MGTVSYFNFCLHCKFGKLPCNQGIEDVIRKQDNICVEKGAEYVNAVQTKYPLSASLMIMYDTTLDVFQGLNNGDCAVALTTVEDWKNFKRDKQYNVNCQMKWVGKRVEFAPASFAVRSNIDKCTALLNDVIDVYLIQMKADGTVQEIWDNYRDANLPHDCMKAEGEGYDSATQSLNVMNMAGIFIFHGAVMGAVIL